MTFWGTPIFVTPINDIYLVVAFGKIIPEDVFNYPPLKTINLHPSLLPKYRGVAPIRWAIINGEIETGISVQKLNEGLDTGDILVQKRISIDENMTAADIYFLFSNRQILSI